jgi:hypothetical protein
MASNKRIANPIAVLAMAAFMPLASMAEEPQVEYHGAGWLQIGRVENSFTTAAHELNDYNKTWMQNSGAVFGANLKINENWDGALGLGTINVHLSRGKTTNANIWYPFWVSFITEARVTHSSSLFTDSDKLALTIGSFGYNYNPDVKNLGLYLVKGYVYPGSLVSGFTGPLGPVSATTGAMASYNVGPFTNDLLFISETDDKPLYDLSIADAVTLKAAPGLEFGAGVNFYRAVAQDKRLTSPGKDCIARSELGEYNNGCFVVDSVGVDALGATIFDTTTGSMAGTKLMGRFHLDPKALFGFEGGMGPGELILYGEVGVIGVKNFSKFYNDIKRRMPVMIGFNFPTWKLLDNLSLEVEYYASKISSDNLGAQYGSWVPTVSADTDNKRDDWKWSLNIDKVVSGHMKISTQVANDHLRLGGYHNYATGVETTTTPKDWYWTSKVVYFF